MPTVNAKSLIKLLASSSAVIPAVASYSLNLYASLSFDLTNYSSYLLALSVGSYIGTLSSLGLTDLSIQQGKTSANRKQGYFQASIVASIALSATSLIAGYFLEFPQGATIGLLCYTALFSITRSYHLHLANLGAKNDLTISRLIRLLTIMLAPLILSVLGHTPQSLLIAQSLGLLLGLLSLNKHAKLKSALEAFGAKLRPSKGEILLLVKRNASLIIDLIHIPAFLLILDRTSQSDSIDRSTLAAIGLSLPAINIATQITTEYLRPKADDLISDNYRLIRALPLLATTTTVFGAALSGVLLKFDIHDLAVIVALAVFSINKLTSAATGLLVYKLSLEKFDLLFNGLTTIAIFTTMAIAPNNQTTLCVILFAITLKYLSTTSVCAHFVNERKRDA